MKQFVKFDCNTVISVDHAFKGKELTGGRIGAFAYPTGYMKGLLYVTELELGKRNN